MADRLEVTANRLRQEAGGLAATQVWSGPASSGFQAASEELANALGRARSAFIEGAGELTKLAAAIQSAQERADAAASRADHASRAAAGALGRLVFLGAGLDARTRGQLEGDLADARADVDAAQASAVDALHDAERAAQAAGAALSALARSAPSLAGALGGGSILSMVPASAGEFPALEAFLARAVGAGRGGFGLAGLGGRSPPAPFASSVDYARWRDLARREAELAMLYGSAQPKTREWEIGDFQGRDEGRLRVGLFIAAPSTGLFGRSFAGNDRGFDPQFSPARTKGYIEIDFQHDRATVVTNPTCDEHGQSCTDAKDIGDGSFGDADSEVELDERDDGSIHVSWEMSNSQLGRFMGPSIDGDLDVKPNSDGSFTVKLSGDDYPSREVYFDDGHGHTQTLVRGKEESPLKLFPVIE